MGLPAPIVAIALLAACGSEKEAVPVPVPGPAPDPAPAPVPAGTTVPYAELERLRLAGDPHIPPDAETIELAVAAGKQSISAVGKLCIDATGTVDNATLLKATGFAAYDQAIVAAMKTWRFRPYEARRVCSPYTFTHDLK